MFFRNSQLEAVRDVVGHVGRGVHKRIDENRELLELLQERAPALLAECPWIEGWLRGHDAFFTELEKVAGIENPMSKFSSSRPYPRPWPGSA